LTAARLVCSLPAQRPGCRSSTRKCSYSTDRTCRCTSRRCGARSRSSTRTSRTRWTTSTGTFDFASWAALSPIDEAIGLVNAAIRVPRVILLRSYDRMPRRHVRFSRCNVFLRDQNRCQYCARQLPRAELNLDHVVPRYARLGRRVWENVVCSCHRCNRVKGGRTPSEAGGCDSCASPSDRSGRRSWRKRSGSVATTRGRRS